MFDRGRLLSACVCITIELQRNRSPRCVRQKQRCRYWDRNVQRGCLIGQCTNSNSAQLSPPQYPFKQDEALDLAEKNTTEMLRPSMDFNPRFQSTLCFRTNSRVQRHRRRYQPYTKHRSKVCPSLSAYLIFIQVILQAEKSICIAAVNGMETLCHVIPLLQLFGIRLFSTGNGPLEDNIEPKPFKRRAGVTGQ